MFLSNYIKNHKDTVGFSFVVDGQECITANPQKMMPIASVMKILVAIEFAK